MSRSQFYSIKLFILRHAWLNLWDKHMTTGRINQVTFLSERDPPSQRGPAGADTRSHERGRSLLAWFLEQNVGLLSLCAQGQVSLVSLILPLRYSSYKAASHAGRTGRAAFRRKTFDVNYHSTDKLNSEGATGLDGFTIVLTICLPIG